MVSVRHRIYKTLTREDYFAQIAGGINIHHSIQEDDFKRCSLLTLPIRILFFSNSNHNYQFVYIVASRGTRKRIVFCLFWFGFFNFHMRLEFYPEF